MTRATKAALAAFAFASLAGCDREAAQGPPAVRVGDSVCDACNMIISDERFATATIIEGPRGPEPRLFDDFNCQARFENRGGEVLARWSHDYNGSGWMPTETAHFVLSPELRTPMASQAAAFATRGEAEAMRDEVGGDVLTFAEAWRRLGFEGE